MVHFGSQDRYAAMCTLPGGGYELIVTVGHLDSERAEMAGQLASDGSRPMTTLAFRSSELASRVVKPLATKAA